MTAREYNECVDMYSDNLYRFALKTLKNEENAKDVVQESYTRLWMKAEDIDATKAKSYLFTTAYHLSIDHFRKEKKSGEFDLAAQNKLRTSQQQPDLNEILHDALSRLPEIQRSVVLLRDYEGYSYREIEEITGLSEPQVKVYIYRARLAMRDYLVKLDYVL
jgi:RNA polymerase sigma factor (sigma-70 family)